MKITFCKQPTEETFNVLENGVISIDGDWRFNIEAEEYKDTWYRDDFDDSEWRILNSGKSWQEQGVVHSGYGCYRFKIFIAKEYKGMPLTLTFTEIKSDDDAWFNGEYIGGISGEYKYLNLIERSYVVPPRIIRYGQINTIAIRIWGGDLTFIGNKSGLTAGKLSAEFNPYHPWMRYLDGEKFPAELFDLSQTQNGKPFEIIFPSLYGVNSVDCEVLDFYENNIMTKTSASVENDAYILSVDEISSSKIYLAGRFVVSLRLYKGNHHVCTATYEMDNLSFKERDQKRLPELEERYDQTPYGVLKLIDEIDASKSILEDPHPYMQSGYDERQRYSTPGSPVNVFISDILGRKARECEYGWFAYRVGRGRLKPRSTYLLRIEYPEDKPRYAPIEIQTGQNYADVGWKNGVGPDDVYDNWPLSGDWQWFDVIVPLDDETVGTGGTGSAKAENGFWVYFMNKIKPGSFFTMYSGGPAVARIRLYEIDPEKNSPVINRPEGLPERVLMFDWERQPDHEPSDLVKYAKLMGYSAISPVILKWHFMNFSEPLNGYDSINIDDNNYWVKCTYDPGSGEDARYAVPSKASVHERYLAATRNSGIAYIPRIEWGGSRDLPIEAQAVNANGEPAVPNRYAPFCANLLRSETWADLEKFIEHLVKPYAETNPQFMGVLWRIRCNRLPVSYSRSDIEMFARETGCKLPSYDDKRLARWASEDVKQQYHAWWHEKRARFHQRLADLLKSYKEDMELYYYNWDEDKFSLIEPDLNSWAFLGQVNAEGNDGRAVYEKDRELRRSLSAQDYIRAMRTGEFGKAAPHSNSAYAILTDLYEQSDGIRLIAPANYLCYADKPDYLNYFKIKSGVTVGNIVSYDEVNARFINPKYEGNMITPGGPDFSMALELLSYFHTDARALTYTAYTYGRGFADAHRRFAQAFLALPAIDGTVIDQNHEDFRVRIYRHEKRVYIGVAYKGYTETSFTVRVPVDGNVLSVKNLVTNEICPAAVVNGILQFEVNTRPMELNAYILVICP